MDHRDHVNLLRNGISQQGGAWADFGSGSGAFTLALRELVGADAEIYSIDKDGARLREQERAFARMFPASRVEFLRADFTQALPLPPLDGIVMANVLHFFENGTPSRTTRSTNSMRDGASKEPVLRHVREFLKPERDLLLVEYNVDVGNVWVPHPLSYETFRTLAPRAGFAEPRLLAILPSRFLREFYAAAARRSA